ncbi:dharma [Acanthochromis polyacanthus]|uniref:dharma n=1 Tax=Acanthochromis polyacanthus TaxID=80966 RepID=UPI002234E4AE|nr:dharma [Acanthochromis polyacanthus]
MAGPRVSDFSIERILSQHFPEASNDQILLRPPAPVPVLVPVPVPVPVADYLQYGGMFYPHGAGFRPPDFTGIHPNSGAFGLQAADVQPVTSCAGFHQPGASAQLQPRPKVRMRTVFTHGQTKQLEALFQLTDYPTGEARAEVAKNTGLSEETVRVWFKNRRARRKRSKAEPAPSGDSEKKMFSCFL